MVKIVLTGTFFNTLYVVTLALASFERFLLLLLTEEMKLFLHV